MGGFAIDAIVCKQKEIGQRERQRECIGEYERVANSLDHSIPVLDWIDGGREGGGDGESKREG